MNTKKEIIEKRSIGLGSSDAKMVAKISRVGKIAETDKQRIAIMLSLDQKSQFSTRATDYGDQIEAQLYNIVVQRFPQAVSNPFYKSEKLSSKFGFAVFNHIDFEVETDSELIWIECKATKNNFSKTFVEYEAQLSWHNMLLCEKAEKLSKKPILMLAHYHVTDYGIFKAENLKIQYVLTAEIDFSKGLELISETIKNGIDYKPQDVLHAESLPATTQNRLQKFAEKVKLRDQLNQEIEDFKPAMLELMEQANLKAVKTDVLQFSRVASCYTQTFDKKGLSQKYPQIAQEFTTTRERKPYLIIKKIENSNI